MQAATQEKQGLELRDKQATLMELINEKGRGMEKLMEQQVCVCVGMHVCMLKLCGNNH